ncbi:hypothetical protein RUND412_002338 [Rhizina undulata]
MFRALFIKPLGAALPKASVFSGGLLPANRNAPCFAGASRISVGGGGVFPRAVFAATPSSRGFVTGTNSAIPRAFPNNNTNGRSNINASSIVIPAGTVASVMKPWTPVQAVTLEPQIAESNKQIFYVKNRIHRTQGKERTPVLYYTDSLQWVALVIYVIVRLFAIILPSLVLVVTCTWHQLEKLPTFLNEFILEDNSENHTKDGKTGKKENVKKGKNGSD